MPLYYFDVRTRDFCVPDEDGTPLADILEAQAEAEGLALAVARDELAGRSEGTIVVAVRGHKGAVLLTASVALKVDRNVALPTQSASREEQLSPDTGQPERAIAGR
jgi:hypothetical protein